MDELICPICQSDNVLPFEEDGPTSSDDTFVIIILSAFAIIGGYAIFVISTYLFFPFVVFLGIFMSSLIDNKKEKKKAPKKKKKRDYICLDCNGIFRQ